jgi:hypothetical protein
MIHPKARNQTSHSLGVLLNNKKTRDRTHAEKKEPITIRKRAIKEVCVFI